MPHPDLTSVRWAIALALTLPLAAGCGANTAPVNGRVTRNGNPVGPGTVIFMPSAGDQKHSAVGQFGADGRYELTTFQPGDGALRGKHRVIIQAAGLEGESYGEETAAAPAGADIPLKYADPKQSGLTATVKPGPNVIDFELR